MEDLRTTVKFQPLHDMRMSADYQFRATRHQPTSPFPLCVVDGLLVFVAAVDEHDDVFTCFAFALPFCRKILSFCRDRAQE